MDVSVQGLDLIEDQSSDFLRAQASVECFCDRGTNPIFENFATGDAA
jgi:hypothetical protein